MIDPSPTTPVECLEARQKIVAQMFSEEAVRISNGLKDGKMTFEVWAPGRDETLMPGVRKANLMLKSHFEQVGWEVAIYGGRISECLWFDLPGTGAKKLRRLKIGYAIVAAVLLVGAAIGGAAWHYSRGSSGKVAEQSDSTLGKMIAKSNFSYVNSDVTETNFPDIGVTTDYKIYNFNRGISSEDAIKEMGKEGYEAANLRELLVYSQNGWNGKDWVVALGQAWRDAPHICGVPGIGWGGRRHLSLYGGNNDWGDTCWFLAVRNSTAEGGH